MRGKGRLHGKMQFIKSLLWKFDTSFNIHVSSYSKKTVENKDV